jgi:hypothetical protein
VTRNHLTILGLAAAVVVLAADQATKWWILDVVRLQDISQIVLLPVLNLTMVWNNGVTFGLLTGFGRWSYLLLPAIALAVVAALGVWLRRAESPLVATALGAIVGGLYAAGWSGGWLSLYGTPFDGTHRPPEKSRPAMAGALQFFTRADPGCASGDSVFKDPRAEPYGPLPADWAKWKGLYLHGGRVVLSYSVGGVPVLELPSASDGPHVIFSRTIRIGPSTQPLLFKVCDVAPGGPTMTPPRTALESEELKKIGSGRRAFSFIGNQAAALLDAPRGIQFVPATNAILLLVPPLTYVRVSTTCFQNASATSWKRISEVSS